MWGESKTIAKTGMGSATTSKAIYMQASGKMTESKGLAPTYSTTAICTGEA